MTFLIWGGGNSVTNNANWISDFPYLYENWYIEYGQYDCPDELNVFWKQIMDEIPITSRNCTDVFYGAPYQEFPEFIFGGYKMCNSLKFGNQDWTETKHIGNISIYCNNSGRVNSSFFNADINKVDYKINGQNVDSVITSDPYSVGLGAALSVINNKNNKTHIGTLNLTSNDFAIYDQNIYVTSYFDEKQFRGSNRAIELCADLGMPIDNININIQRTRSIDDKGTVPAAPIIITNYSYYYYADIDNMNINVTCPYSDNLIYEYDGIYGRGPISNGGNWGTNIPKIKQLIYDYNYGTYTASNYYTYISTPPIIENLHINLTGKLFDKLYFVNNVNYRNNGDIAKYVHNLDLTVDFNGRTDMDVTDFANYDTILSKSIHIKNMPASLKSKYTADCFDIINVIE